MLFRSSAGLVKMYAMVNIQKYTLVATANTVEECEKQYREMLVSNKIIEDDTGTAEEYTETKTVTGTIEKIAQAVTDGNSHFYIVLSGASEIYDVNVSDNIGIVLTDVGDSVTLEYVDQSVSETETVYKVTKVKSNTPK